MSDIPDVNDFPITFLIGTIMTVLPVLILCQFKKMEKKKETVLSISHFPTAENSDSVKKQTANSMERKKMAEKNNKAMNQISSEKVMEKLKRTEVMHKAEKSLKMAEKVEHVPNNLKTHNSKERRGRSYQIIGDLDTTDSSFEYSLDNTLAMESLEMIKGKHGLVLEGEEIDHQMVKVPQRSDSSDYSLFDSQSSRRDIREQRFRLFKLNTSVARRVAAVLEDSIISTSTQDKKEKPATEAVNFKFL
ncbi:hypothetical protein ACH3XW_29675 [Acanthocheilonema viteae]